MGRVPGACSRRTMTEPGDGAWSEPFKAGSLDLDLGTLVPALARRGSSNLRLGCCRAGLRRMEGRNWARGWGPQWWPEALSEGHRESSHSELDQDCMVGL